MELLIIGSRGMLGKRMHQDALVRGWKVQTVARTDADFCLDLNNPELLYALKDKVHPQVVVNCAALTEIDECERDWEKGRRVNAIVPRVLGELSAGWRAYLIQVSTDHFYSNDVRLRHRESDLITLKNNYAKTKLLGEQAALAYAGAVVVRTNIMGFRLDPRKYTLIEWILKALFQQKKMAGFDDFFTSGMSVGALSRTLLQLAEEERPVGRWNIAGRDVFSKLDLILAVGREFGLSTSQVQAAPVASFSGVVRAESLGLDSSRIEKLLGAGLPGLSETVAELHDEYRRSNEIQKFIQNWEA